MTWPLKNIKFLCPEKCFGCFSSMLWVTYTVKPINLFLFTSIRRHINHTHYCDLVPIAAFTVTLYLRIWVGFVYFVWFFVSLYLGWLSKVFIKHNQATKQTGAISLLLGLPQRKLLLLGLLACSSLVCGKHSFLKYSQWELLNRKPQQRNQDSIVCLQNLPCVPNQKKTGDKDRYRKQNNCHKHPLAPCWVRKG